MSRIWELLPFQDMLHLLAILIGYCLLTIYFQTLKLETDRFVQLLLELLFVVFLVQFIVAAITQFLEVLQVFTVIYATIYPLLLTFLTALQSLFMLASISPIFIAVNVIYSFLLEKLLIPLIVGSFFLTVSTQLYPAISFTRLVQFIRKAVLICIALYMMVYTSILAISTLAIRFSTSFGMTLRKLFEQNVPLVGTVLTEIFALIRQFKFVTTSALSLSALVAVALVLFVPVITMLLYSVTLFAAAAIVEPLLGGAQAHFLEELAKTLLLMTAIAFIFMSQLFVTVIILYVGVNFSWSS